MGSIRTVENIAKLVKTSVTTLSLPASRINIGAQQYVTILSKTLDTSIIGPGGLDSSISSSSVYYVYAVFYNSNVYLIGSVSSVSPSGFSQSRKVGAFTTGATSQILEAFYCGQVLTSGEWQSYIPTFTGFGTVSGVDAWWKRNGSSIIIKCKFATGTCTATEARMSLPAGLTSGTVNALTYLGEFAQSLVYAGGFQVYVENGVSYLTFGSTDSGNIGYTKRNGSQVAGNGANIGFVTAEFPITEWAGSGTQFIW